jgi:glycosyltransferase involved in cell wall biosynthesis
LIYVRAEAIDAAGKAAAAGLAEFLSEARRLRFSQRLATDIVTGAPPHAACARELSPEYQPVLRRRLEEVRRELPDPPTVASRMRPRQLHIVHGWGGGAADWVQGFCATDGHENFVLRASSLPGRPGVHLDLFHSADTPVETWPLEPAIISTAVSHNGYRAAIGSICERYGIGRVFVSSFIGHSLDALRTGLPTVIVFHDYYPFYGHPLDDLFPNVPPADWMRLRNSFAEAIAANPVRLVAPTPSVERNFTRLLPQLAGRFHIIPHGIKSIDGDLIRPAADATRPLRAVVLGRLAPHKGAGLLREVITSTPGIEYVLLGSGDGGEPFRGNPAVTVIPHYRHEELPELIRSFQPDVGLLLSTVHETFSYTLSELFALGIPPLATSLGAFADRIRDGVNGFLAEPTAEAIRERLLALSKDRSALLDAHQNIRHSSIRGLREMVRDYRALDLSPEQSDRAYFRSNGVSFTACRLYWAAPGEGFNRDRSVSAPLAMTPSVRRIRLPLPPFHRAAPARIRFDPAAQPGFLAIHRIEIQAVEGHSLWRWAGEDTGLSSMTFNQLAPAAAKGAAAFYMTGEAPYVAIPLEPALAALLRAGGWVEIDLSFPSGAVVMRELAADLNSLRSTLAAREGLLAEYKSEQKKRAARYASDIAKYEKERAAREAELRKVTESRDRLLAALPAGKKTLLARLAIAGQALGLHRLLKPPR